MRTAVTLDADVARLLKEESARSCLGFKVVLNKSIRLSLRPVQTSQPHLLSPRALGFQPGVDPRHLRKLADDMAPKAFPGFKGLHG